MKKPLAIQRHPHHARHTSRVLLATTHKCVRLQRRLRQWRQITSNPAILRMVEVGLEFELTHTPTRRRRGPCFRGNAEQQQSLLKQLQEWLEEGSIEPTNLGEAEIISLLFPIKQKDKFRWCLDLRFLNRALEYRRFKLDNLEAVRYLIDPGDVICLIDLKSAYMHVKINRKYRRYLCFRANDKLWRFRAGVFGLASMPRKFTELTKPIMQTSTQTKDTMFNLSRRHHHYRTDKASVSDSHTNRETNISKPRFHHQYAKEHFGTTTKSRLPRIDSRRANGQILSLGASGEIGNTETGGQADQRSTPKAKADSETSSSSDRKTGVFNARNAGSGIPPTFSRKDQKLRSAVERKRNVRLRRSSSAVSHSTTGLQMVGKSVTQDNSHLATPSAAQSGRDTHNRRVAHRLRRGAPNRRPTPKTRKILVRGRSKNVTKHARTHRSGASFSSLLASNQNHSSAPDSHRQHNSVVVSEKDGLTSPSSRTDRRASYSSDSSQSDFPAITPYKRRKQPRGRPTFATSTGHERMANQSESISQHLQPLQHTSRSGLVCNTPQREMSNILQSPLVAAHTPVQRTATRLGTTDRLLVSANKPDLPSDFQNQARRRERNSRDSSLDSGDLVPVSHGTSESDSLHTSRRVHSPGNRAPDAKRRVTAFDRGVVLTKIAALGVTTEWSQRQQEAMKKFETFCNEANIDTQSKIVSPDALSAFSSVPSIWRRSTSRSNRSTLRNDCTIVLHQ